MRQRSRLRVYCGPESAQGALTESPVDPHTVQIPLGEILPMLADAVRSERTWLKDFEDEPVSISTDLYEMILAYQHCRRPSA